MTPQSEVAEQLRNIGDTVHKEYGKVFESAFDKMLSVPKEKLSYSFAEIILNELTENIPSYSQRVSQKCCKGCIWTKIIDTTFAFE